MWEKRVFYPIGTISGNGFVGMRVLCGGTLKIKDVATLIAKDNIEYALTCEGVFQINFPNTKDETWDKIDHFPQLMMEDLVNPHQLVMDAVSELKEILFDLTQLVASADQIEFNNEGGVVELYEKDLRGQVKSYALKEGARLHVKGYLEVAPADLKVTDSTVSYL